MVCPVNHRLLSRSLWNQSYPRTTQTSAVLKGRETTRITFADFGSCGAMYSYPRGKDTRYSRERAKQPKRPILAGGGPGLASYWLAGCPAWAPLTGGNLLERVWS